MNNIEKAVGSVRRRGTATISNILNDHPGMTRDQAIKALQNAAHRDLVHTAGYDREISGRGLRRVAIYAIGVKPEPSPEAARNGWRFGRVASVWDFGQGVTV